MELASRDWSGHYNLWISWQSIDSFDHCADPVTRVIVVLQDTARLHVPNIFSTDWKKLRPKTSWNVRYLYERYDVDLASLESLVVLPVSNLWSVLPIGPIVSYWPHDNSELAGRATLGTQCLLWQVTKFNLNFSDGRVLCWQTSEESNKPEICNVSVMYQYPGELLVVNGSLDQFQYIDVCEAIFSNQLRICSGHRVGLHLAKRQCLFTCHTVRTPWSDESINYHAIYIL